MARKCEAPAGKAGATRDQAGGLTRNPYSLDVVRAQFLVQAHHVRPELATMLAALAFGGPA